MKKILSRTPSQSETIKTEVVCPNDTNPMGILQGGRLVEWMDIAAAVCAQTHAGKICVTASIDEVAFRHPAKIGDILIINARITRAFSSSMEVLVDAFARKVTGTTKILISEAYFTIVALDDMGHPAAVIPVRPVTVQQKKDYEEAIIRKSAKAKRR